MRFLTRGNEKGFALINVYLVSVIILAIAGGTYTRALVESKEVGREITRLQIRSAAEAALQSALVQIGVNPNTGNMGYTGFINTNSVTRRNLQTYNGVNVIVNNARTNFSYTITNPNQADWAVITATGGSTANQSERITLEARVFLDSNLSKYMMYANTPDFGLGGNLQMGTSVGMEDGINPEGVPLNEVERNMLYYTGNLGFGGDNIEIWGDVNAQGEIRGNSSSRLHGDSYAGAFATDAFGRITNSGVTGGLGMVGDGFADDFDRDGNGFVEPEDSPDHHDLTQNGGGDAHKYDIVRPLDLAFYRTRAPIVPGINGIDVVRYTGNTDQFLEFQTAGEVTRIVQYSDAGYTTQTGSYVLASKNGLIYVDRDAYVKGEIKGRVTVVSNRDIYYTGHIKYAGNQSVVNPDNPSDAAAFLARRRQLFLPSNLEVSGILYAENQGRPLTSVAFDANYRPGTSPYYQPVNDGGTSKQDGHFRHFGNTVMNGTGNTSAYRSDRAYVYDPNLKNYRPPGVPIQPVIRLVREAPNP